MLQIKFLKAEKFIPCEIYRIIYDVDGEARFIKEWFQMG